MAPRRLEALPGVAKDLKALPTRRLQEIALTKIAAARDGRLTGRPLGVQVRTGDLSDCRKIDFDERADRPPGWRIVYRELRDDTIEIIEIVAVGARANAAAYFSAAERLERQPEPPDAADPRQRK